MASGCRCGGYWLSYLVTSPMLSDKQETLRCDAQPRKNTLFSKKNLQNALRFNFTLVLNSNHIRTYALLYHHHFPANNTHSIFSNSFTLYEAGRGAETQSVTVNATGCGFDPHSRTWNIYLNVYFHFFALMSRQSAALSPATQHAMPGGKWWTECLNTRFPQPTPLCAGYSVKLILPISNAIPKRRYITMYLKN